MKTKNQLKAKKHFNFKDLPKSLIVIVLIMDRLLHSNGAFN
jgi:hypothetical protein